MRPSRLTYLCSCACWLVKPISKVNSGNCSSSFQLACLLYLNFVLIAFFQSTLILLAISTLCHVNYPFGVWKPKGWETLHGTGLSNNRVKQYEWGKRQKLIWTFDITLTFFIECRYNGFWMPFHQYFEKLLLKFWNIKVRMYLSQNCCNSLHWDTKRYFFVSNMSVPGCSSICNSRWLWPPLGYLIDHSQLHRSL